MLFKENAQLRQDYLKRNLNHTEENGECEMACEMISLFMKLGMPLQSQRMELYRANQLINQTRRKKSWLCDESEMRIRAFQGDRARNCREIEELQRICCVDTDRARHLRCDELSTQKEENNSAVNQFMVQIQELQDKVNSLNDAKESYDPETASSSGVSHVPSQPMSIRTARGMTSRDTELIVYIRTRF